MQISTIAAEFEGLSLLIQTIRFSNSLMINISSEAQKLRHLSLTVPTRFVDFSYQDDLPLTRTLFDDQFSEVHQEAVDTLSKSLGKKLGYPVYLSYNLDIHEPMQVKRVCAQVRKIILENFGASTEPKPQPNLEMTEAK